MEDSHIWKQDNGDPPPTWWFKFIWNLNKKRFIVSTINSCYYLRFCITHSPDEPFVSSTTLLASELCLSSLETAPLVAQLQRICLLPSHFPEKLNHSLTYWSHRTNDFFFFLISEHRSNEIKMWRHIYWTETIYVEGDDRSRILVNKMVNLLTMLHLFIIPGPRHGWGGGSN